MLGGNFASQQNEAARRRREEMRRRSMNYTPAVNYDDYVSPRQAKPKTDFYGASNFGFGGRFAEDQNEIRRQERQRQQMESHGPMERGTDYGELFRKGLPPQFKIGKSIWDQMASAMKNYTFEGGWGKNSWFPKVMVGDERDGVRDYDKNPPGTMPGDDDFRSGIDLIVGNLSEQDAGQEMADIEDIMNDENSIPGPGGSITRTNKYVDSRQQEGEPLRYPTREVDDQMKLLKDTIAKLEAKPDKIDFSMLASYFGMDPRPFKPDMTRWEKEKTIIGLKEKMAELKSERKLALDKQEYMFQREKLRLKERDADRRQRFEQFRLKYGTKAAKNLAKSKDDQEKLAKSLKTQMQNTLNDIAGMRFGIPDDDPELDTKLKSNGNLIHAEVIEEAKVIRKENPTMSFSDAYRAAIEDIAGEEELIKLADEDAELAKKVEGLMDEGYSFYDARVEIERQAKEAEQRESMGTPGMPGM